MNQTPTRSVPFFNYPHVYRSHEAELLETFKSVASRGAFILQDDLRKFETELAEFSGCKYALGVANGTDAIWLALMAGGIKANDEVIVCSHTYVATAAAVHFVGAIPVLIECGHDHMMDCSKIEAAITNRTRAIMPTQLNGRCSDMDAVAKVAKKHNLMIFEDAAQGLGAKFNGRCAGTFGVAGTISFYPAKTLGSFGDGGAILCNDDQVYETLYALRDHGRNSKGNFVAWGYNSRLDNLQAAFLRVKLRTYAADIERRRQIARIYHEELGNTTQVSLPPHPDADAKRFDIFQNFEIEADDRNQLQAWLKEHGVGSLVQWGGQVVHQIPGLGFNTALPFTERMISRALMLPMNTSLSNEDIAYVCNQVKQFYQLGILQKAA